MSALVIFLVAVEFTFAALLLAAIFKS